MAQTEVDRRLSLALLEPLTGQPVRGPQLFPAALCPVVGSSWRRSESLSSVAPILRRSAPSLSPFLLSLFARGHLYFAE